MGGKETPSPELLELKVHRSWTKLIDWVERVLPFGQVCVRVINGNPGRLVQEHTYYDLRFDQDRVGPRRPAEIGEIDFLSIDAFAAGKTAKAAAKVK